VTDRCRVLVLCHANVARSVAAAALLDGATGGRGELVEVRSAGTHATEGQPVSSRTRTALAVAVGRDVPLGAHRAHQVDDDDISWADLIIAMEASQVRWLRRRFPTSAPRAATLADVATRLAGPPGTIAERVAASRLDALEPADEGDVADPAGGDDAAYLDTMQAIAGLCEAVRERLHG